jgi:hypothetical protein
VRQIGKLGVEIAMKTAEELIKIIRSSVLERIEPFRARDIAQHLDKLGEWEKTASEWTRNWETPDGSVIRDRWIVGTPTIQRTIALSGSPSWVELGKL